MCHSASAPVIDRTARTPTATARVASAPSSTRRRSKRSLATPPTSSRTIVGTVIAMPTIASAVGVFDSAYTCQAIATRNAPSPSSETDIPVQSRRKSRWRSGASERTPFPALARSSAS